jgi:hypothetical protein
LQRQVARFGAGPLIGELLVAAETAVLDPSAAPAFLLYSGHDTGPMGPVLAALGIGGAEFPRFADLLSLELHCVTEGANNHTAAETASAASAYAVRIVHNGAVVTSRVAGCPAGEELCPYAAFHAAAAALVPTPEECGRDDAPAGPDWWPVPISAHQL